MFILQGTTRMKSMTAWTISEQVDCPVLGTVFRGRHSRLGQIRPQLYCTVCRSKLKNDLAATPRKEIENLVATEHCTYCLFLCPIYCVYV